MASEIRVDKINSLSGVGTVTLSPTGVDIAGITTASTLRATTGIVTSLQVTGNAGIGTNNPARALHLHDDDSDTVQLHITNATTGTSGSDGVSFALGSDESLIINQRESNDIALKTADTERLRIDSNGKVVIGHNASVAGDGSSEFALQILGTDYVTSGLNQQRFANDVSGPSIILGKSRGTSIGTHTIVQNGDQLGKIRFYGSDGNDFNNYGAEIAANVDATPGSDDMPGRLVFSTTPDGSTGATERVRITHDGKVGINETSPAAQLDVEGSGVPVIINSSNSNTYKIQLENAGTTLGYIGAVADAIVFSNSSAAEQARFTDAGLKLPSGRGIDFSATSDSSGTMSSELLDDYEEGTWTPALTFGGGSTGITYANRGGNYTKIGRQVTLNFMMELSSKGSSTGDAVVGGLPYTVTDLLAGTVIEASGASSYWNNIDPDLMFLAWSASTNNNQLTPRFQPETGAADAVDSLDDANFTNSTNFRGSITYFTS